MAIIASQYQNVGILFWRHGWLKLCAWVALGTPSQTNYCRTHFELYALTFIWLKIKFRVVTFWTIPTGNYLNYSDYPTKRGRFTWPNKYDQNIMTLLIELDQILTTMNLTNWTWPKNILFSRKRQISMLGLTKPWQRQTLNLKIIVQWVMPCWLCISTIKSLKTASKSWWHDQIIVNIDTIVPLSPKSKCFWWWAILSFSSTP